MKKSFVRLIAAAVLTLFCASALCPLFSGAFTANVVAAYDLNGDGELTVEDVTTLLNTLSTAPDAEPGRADMNRDGVASIKDVTLLLGILARETRADVLYSSDENYAAFDDIALSRYAGAEGMVLLENRNNALPLARGASVALFGGGQVDFIKGGTGSGDVNALYLVNLLDGMRAKAEEGKISIYEPLSQKYEENTSYVPDTAMVTAAAEAASEAIVVISRNSGENVDLTSSKFVLSAAEKSLLQKVSSAGFAHVTVLLNVGTVMDTSFYGDYPLDALLVCWQPGMEGGNATADVLCGDICPSGKTVDTWASSYGAYPSSKNFSGSAYALYTEDIFVGYRYFETFDPDYTTVNYPFGYGLSYTSFDISTPVVTEKDGFIEVRVTVTNTGAVSGKETAQVYFSSPRGRLGAPGKALGAFAKTKLLSPGESEELKMSFAVKDMAMYDDTGVISAHAWILEAGDYRIFCGNSVKNAGERGVCYTHTESADRIVEQLDGKIAPTTLNKRLNADGSYETLDASGYLTELFPGVTTIDACGYTIQNSQAVLVSNSTGSVYGMELTGGNTLYYNVSAPADADYTLTFNACVSTASAAEEALRVTLNGRSYTTDLARTGNARFTIGESGEVTLPLQKGANYLKVSVTSNMTGKFILCSLTFDDGTGAGETDLRSAEKQSISIASGESIDFAEVYDDPSLMRKFVESLTPSQMITLLCGHAPNVGHGDGSLAGLPDKGVTYLDTSDGPAGLDLTVPQVAWPIETALACTWNTQLIYEVGVKIGEECVKAGVDVWLAPGINIHRDPLGGRNFEYFSEDPLVSGKMASALTQGVQSTGKAGVMIKHLYANSRESGRVDGNSSISERAARMIYLKAFEICIKEAAPWSVMTTYNSTNGVYNAENKALLTGVLREEWGFEGFICTDWGAHSEQFREIYAGNDAKMSWGYPESCLAAYKAGVLPLETLRASATRLLEAALKSGTMYRAVTPIEYKHDVNGETRIKAIEYASKDEDIGSESCSDVDGGFIPNYCQSGRWLTYDLNVGKAGIYNLVVRASSTNTDSDFDLYIDETLVGRFTWDKGSGSWSVWRTLTTGLTFDLTEGEHTLRLKFYTAMNINWFELKEGEAEEPEDTTTHKVNGTTRIKAIDFLTCSSGIGTENCSDIGGGTIPNYCQSGRSLTYALKVTAPGTYGMTIRAATENVNSDFVLYLDETEVGHFTWASGSGGWQKWQTLDTGISFALSSGEHTLRLQFYTAMNVNWFELTPAADE